MEVPRFQPFQGLRYEPTLAPIEDVTAPPYDVIDASERAVLAAKSPYNAIHVELPEEDPATGGDRYAHAAALFRIWQSDGALRLDAEPCFYVYRMRFVDELGISHTSTGVIGALDVDAAGTGSVLPHEQTMPKPKGDRLDLLRATAKNTSPIWGLSLAAGLSRVCADAVEHATPIRVTDEGGIVHELFVVSDEAVIDRIEALVASTPVVIADGHHRYETATFYRAEQHEVHSDHSGDYDAVMALVVELSPDELFVQAIHRLISGLAVDVDILEEFAPFFEISEGPSDPAELGRNLIALGALGMLTPTGNFYLRPKSIVSEKAEAELDSSRLDVALSALPAHDLVYQHGITHVADAVNGGTAQVGILLRPATVAQIADTAHSGKRMPPKTTFFYPKPRTGMVYRSITDA
jgi:uncharacterized protein (DUF1015 family)